MSERITIRAELDLLLTRVPFDQFSIVMASGDRYLIENASEIVVAHDAMLVIPLRRGGYSILRSNQISSIDVLEPEQIATSP